LLHALKGHCRSFCGGEAKPEHSRDTTREGAKIFPSFFKKKRLFPVLFWKKEPKNFRKWCLSNYCKMSDAGH
jgi:hypothetical protein